jgi:hypothetical protein
MTSNSRDTGSRAPQGPDTERLKVEGGGERQRAAIALGILAIAALIVVGIMVAVLGSHGGNPAPSSIANPTGPAVTVTGGGSNRPSAPQPSQPNGRKTHTQPATPPPNRPVSCPTNDPCGLGVDVGNAIAALNTYRQSHGKPPVHGTVTSAARQCALTSGDNCPNGYFWEPVGRSGRQVIQKIAAKSDGATWLLDDRMTRVQVGWAYLPSSHSFYCALISNAS